MTDEEKAQRFKEALEQVAEMIIHGWSDRAIERWLNTIYQPSLFRDRIRWGAKEKDGVLFVTATFDDGKWLSSHARCS